MIPSDLMETVQPYGGADEASVAAFEAIIGARLPADYRKYLLQFNGGEPRRTIFSPKGNVRDGFNLHHVLGLHEGPEYLRLQDRWKVGDHYDLAGCVAGERDFIVIGDCSTGSLVLLNLVSGAVYVLEPDTAEPGGTGAGNVQPVFVSGSFQSFVAELRSEGEWLEISHIPDERAELERRILALKKEYWGK